MLPLILPPVRSCLEAWGCHGGSQSPLPTGGARSSTWGQQLRLALWAAAACLPDEPEGGVGPPPGSMLSTSAFPGGVARRGRGAASWEALQNTGQESGVQASSGAGLMPCVDCGGESSTAVDHCLTLAPFPSLPVCPGGQEHRALEL